jgi:uncharacterized protein
MKATDLSTFSPEPEVQMLAQLNSSRKLPKWLITLLTTAFLVAPFDEKSVLAAAASVAVGERLPDLSIDEKGELIMQGDDVDYRPWSYPQQPGKVHIVQYMAATKSAGDMNKAFRDRFDTDLPKNTFRTTTILNLDDAIWGTGGFVVSQLKSNKLKYPQAVMVLDKDGAGITRWQLQNDSSAVVVVDQQGIIRYIKQGKMSGEEIESTLQLILGYIGQPQS